MSSGTAKRDRRERADTAPRDVVVRVRNWKESLVQEKIRGDEAALDRIHGETSLLKHGEAQQDGISGLSKRAVISPDRAPVRGFTTTIST